MSGSLSKAASASRNSGPCPMKTQGWSSQPRRSIRDLVNQRADSSNTSTLHQ